MFCCKIYGLEQFSIDIQRSNTIFRANPLRGVPQSLANRREHPVLRLGTSKSNNSIADAIHEGVVVETPRKVSVGAIDEGRVDTHTAH